jgi:hypothetical protein
MEKIKNKCVSCGIVIKNTKSGYNIRGNYCVSCSSKSHKIYTWRSLYNSEYRTKIGEAKMNKLYDEILQRWGIDMLSPAQYKYNNYKLEYAK